MSYAHNVRSKRKRREREGFILHLTEVGDALYYGYPGASVDYFTDCEAYNAWRKDRRKDAA